MGSSLKLHEVAVVIGNHLVLLTQTIEREVAVILVLEHLVFDPGLSSFLVLFWQILIQVAPLRG